MKERLIQLLGADNSFAEDRDVAMHEFGLSREKHYDVLVVAPGWKPTKIMVDYDAEITCTKEHSYISGYEVKGKGFLIGWIQCSTGVSSLIDELSTCAYLNFDKLVFVGAVGSLVPEIGLGTLCTPEWCISGNLANGYLLEDIRQYKPFGKVYPNNPAFVQQVVERYPDMIQAPVFCTDSTEKSNPTEICFGTGARTTEKQEKTEPDQWSDSAECGGAEGQPVLTTKLSKDYIYSFRGDNTFL